MKILVGQLAAGLAEPESIPINSPKPIWRLGISRRLLMPFRWHYFVLYGAWDWCRQANSSHRFAILDNYQNWKVTQAFDAEGLGWLNQGPLPRKLTTNLTVYAASL